MYICLCNGYRESELRDMARKGFTVAEEAYEAMGDGPCCGQCVDFAQEVIDEERTVPCVADGAADCGAAGVVGDFDAGLAADRSDRAESHPAEKGPADSALNDASA
jgi:bacterioferritin-associated ferredoxin